MNGSMQILLQQISITFLGKPNQRWPMYQKPFMANILISMYVEMFLLKSVSTGNIFVKLAKGLQDS